MSKPMIKSEIINEAAYPCLKMHMYSEFIVLFTRDSTGFVVKSGPTDEHSPFVGHFADYWNESEFVDFSGKVVLHNQD